ncbi:hypothetical protein B1813_19070 [Saccharomonospora piscinae]|uniref:Uncharacterized protein n=1 Tax=Saccharomonospora piscinae TaxID=687388 RepID=A0A1V8ZYW8_SACPI|nr:N-acetylmuramoyl-L-alanine amidase [Saccharomonospora piscinae]OQO89943.1 hypothetical protein B1813_19070 [Saccharomonospora piscinae]
MAIFPAADYQPLGRQTEPRMSSHDIFCFHTMVGSLAGTDAYFEQGGYYGVESHFGVGGSSDGVRDGYVIQWQDTTYCADANLDGKPTVLSVETSDGGDPDRPWSPRQIDALVDLAVWVCRTHNIPPVLIPDTRPGRRGLAYHRQGCDHSSSYRPRGAPYDQWRVPGGVKWSGVLGKVCPGDVRIRQLVDTVIPRIQAAVGGGGGSAPSANPAQRYYQTKETTVLLPTGKNTLTVHVPKGAKNVVLNCPVGKMAARIQWAGSGYPKTRGQFPNDGDQPDAKWVAKDALHMDIDRMRPWLVDVPDKARSFKLNYTYRPKSILARLKREKAFGSLDFEF